MYSSKLIQSVISKSSRTLLRKCFSSRPDIGQASSMLDFGTRSILNEDHDLFRETVRKFVQEEVVPHHDQWEKDGHVSKELWRKAGEYGLLGIETSEEDHGLGADFITAMILPEELAYANCSGPGFALHNSIVMPYISHYGSREQKDKYLPRMTSGELISAVAMTEPGAGSDLQGIRTTARRVGSDWIINGSKTFITNGWMADLVLVVAITDPDAKSPARGTSLFFVEAGTPGFTKGKRLKKIGLKAQDTSEMFFDDVRVPQEALLGEGNAGFFYLMSELPQERLLIADISQSLAEFAFEETRRYVRERRAFGKTLSHLQTVQHKLAEMKADICAGRSFVDSCMLLHNEGRCDAATASMAKMWCSNMVNRVVTECLQLHGGWGYMWEYPIAKAFVDARLQPIYGGANEIMKELIARTIVRQ